MLFYGRSGYGTPVPKRDVELKAHSSGPVVTYRLSPEELQQYLQDLTKRQLEKQPFALPRKKPKKEETAMPELTRDEYLRLRLEGKGRTEIMKQYFSTNQTRFYRALKEWGIREKEDEEKDLQQLRSAWQPAVKPQEMKVEQQEPHPKEAIAELDRLLAEKTTRIKELEETVSRLEAEMDAERAVLLQTIEKAVDDIASAQINHDPVNHPSHYTAGKVECIDAIEAATVGLTGGAAYCTGNAIKYLWSWSRKGGVEDLQKARWYIDRLIETATNKS